MSKNIEIEKKYLVINGVNSIGGVALSNRARDFYIKNGYTISPRGTDYIFIKELR